MIRAITVKACDFDKLRVVRLFLTVPQTRNFHFFSLSCTQLAHSSFTRSHTNRGVETESRSDVACRSDPREPVPRARYRSSTPELVHLDIVKSCPTHSVCNLILVHLDRHFCDSRTMSLNGLDAPHVQEAYNAALTESGGWWVFHNPATLSQTRQR